jgi:hypothetical protein
MIKELKQLLDSTVHVLFHVRDRSETANLFNSFQQQMQTRQPLLPRSGILLRVHPVCKEILKIYEELDNRSEMVHATLHETSRGRRRSCSFTKIQVIIL